MKLDVFSSETDGFAWISNLADSRQYLGVAWQMI
jgi:hypothetical protein